MPCHTSPPESRRHSERFDPVPELSPFTYQTLAFGDVDDGCAIIRVMNVIATSIDRRHHHLDLHLLLLGRVFPSMSILSRNERAFLSTGCSTHPLLRSSKCVRIGVNLVNSAAQGAKGTDRRVQGGARHRYGLLAQG
ncbi:hypothetical protein Hypma_011232 [Hypsizygus marmoreus]|uniref:Uncharacterized protein n=1 Tax=Hypsizygus marmoreus TaxID=39966 RepID=A0A369JHM6_HYPMA|nr:hypothetical protein Hypma_011232 [Hypsizygus marmoreus]